MVVVVTTVLVGARHVEGVTVARAAAGGGPGWPPIEHAAGAEPRHTTRPATSGLDCFRMRPNMPSSTPNGCPNP